MGELLGVWAAMLSSTLGGTAIGVTRFVIGKTDPLTLGVFRFGIGFLLLWPVAVLRHERWPARRDWPGVVGLGLLFFGLFPALFNASLAFTTAARGAIALSTLPLLTMLAGAAIGTERLTGRKTLGVLIAMAGVVAALVSGLSSAPAGAWRGDLLMIAAALCMAIYNVGSKPFIGRSSPIGFTVVAMGVGAVCLTAISAARGGFAPVAQFGPAQWWAVSYLGVFGGAIGFYLWAFALGRTTPTLVALSVTLNPIAAALVGTVLLDEPIRLSLVVGMTMVLAGIAIATTRRR
ncbi:hypothetical protein BH11PSE13_BH11PSE13_35010 [soil metagenome]